MEILRISFQLFNYQMAVLLSSYEKSMLTSSASYYRVIKNYALDIFSIATFFLRSFTCNFIEREVIEIPVSRTMIKYSLLSHENLICMSVICVMNFSKVSDITACVLSI